MDNIKTGLLAQIANQALPAQNRDAMQTIYNTIDGHPHANQFNSLGSVSGRVQKNANFIKCEDMLLQLLKFDEFDALLATVIDEVFGAALSVIQAFTEMVTGALSKMAELIAGLDAVEAAVLAIVGIIKTATDMLENLSNPCLKAAAETTYKYLSTSEKETVDAIKNISNPNDRNLHINQLMKSTSNGKFL